MGLDGILFIIMHLFLKINRHSFDNQLFLRILADPKDLLFLWFIINQFYKFEFLM